MKSHVSDVPLFKIYLEDQDLAESTIDEYTKVVSRFLESEPDVSDVESYNDFLRKYSIKKRCYHYSGALKHYIRFKAESKREADKIIGGLIKVSMPNDIVKERRYLSDEKILDVINHMEFFKHKIIALIQHTCGVRFHDVVTLKRDALFFEDYEGERVLRLSLTGKRRKRNVVHIFDKTVQKLVNDYYKDPGSSVVEGYVFLEYPGRGENKEEMNMGEVYAIENLNYQWYYRDMQDACKMVGVAPGDFATHDLRRCFARRFWTKYRDVQALQNVLRHARPSSTLRYLEHSGMQNIEYFKEMQAD